MRTTKNGHPHTIITTNTNTTPTSTSTKPPQRVETAIASAVMAAGARDAAPRRHGTASRAPGMFFFLFFFTGLNDYLILVYTYKSRGMTDKRASCLEPSSKVFVLNIFNCTNECFKKLRLQMETSARDREIGINGGFETRVLSPSFFFWPLAP
jgi:hypothetical protein